MPGLAGSGDEFSAQVAWFGGGRPGDAPGGPARRRVVAVEPFTGGDLSVDGQARQLAALLEGQGDAPCVVVGHSHGGLVALSLAVQRPELIAGLVLLDVPLLLPPLARVLARLPLALLRTPLRKPLLRRFFRTTFREADGSAWRAEVLARLDRVPAHVVRAVVGGTFTYDSTSRLRALAVPAVCVRANIPVRLDRLPAAVRRVEITGVGHWPHVHAPEATHRAVEALLSG
ncbi:alpha/beta hydrolase [Dactylosporangium sp. NPDC049525]|uniref:alpha/beta fold hydrolase n=1 Tax=Dactylosporangium sp. NPDC049525 TaxID=3154730 RepID=UPI0034191F6A